MGWTVGSAARADGSSGAFAQAARRSDSASVLCAGNQEHGVAARHCHEAVANIGTSADAVCIPESQRLRVAGRLLGAPFAETAVHRELKDNGAIGIHQRKHRRRSERVAGVCGDDSFGEGNEQVRTARCELRNDAQDILLAIARDIDNPQSLEQQSQKSKGRQHRLDTSDTAAESHALARFASSFDINEMVSEYRALRGSVIRLWVARAPQAAGGTLDGLTRFNEGIDQALTESVVRFSDQVDESRELYMSVLGHDLRTPLQVIVQSTAYLSRSRLQENQQKAIVQVERSARQVTQMVEDLLDVTRIRFGGSLPVNPQPMDANTVLHAVAAEFDALHPARDLRVQVEGDLKGTWDAGRLHQMLTNLVRNAFQHGDASTRVSVRAFAESHSVTFSVHNFGEPIPLALLPQVFEPLKRGSARTDTHGKTGLGLGLYIAAGLAQAHRGTLRVESTRDHGTTFVACLPR
jgi:signal transduction histidine kinase